MVGIQDVGKGKEEKYKNKQKLHKDTYNTSNELPVNADSFQSPAPGALPWGSSQLGETGSFLPLHA